MPPHFRIKKLRHSPGYPTQIEAHTVFHCRHIQLFGHGVYMHYFEHNCQRLFLSVCSTTAFVAMLEEESLHRRNVKSWCSAIMARSRCPIADGQRGEL